MNIEPILENEFYHDGRGPCLKKVVWKRKNKTVAGFLYFNPDAENSNDDSIKHIKCINARAHKFTEIDMHENIVATSKSKAAIFELIDSTWAKIFNIRNGSNYKHYQIMFYDEVYDVICEQIIAGKGRFRSP